MNTYSKTNEATYCHQVYYRNAMLHAWIKRNGNRRSYKPEDLPAYIDPPTNEEMSAAEVITFKRGVARDGESYPAYLAKRDGAWLITTWMGDPLASVTNINARRVRVGYLSDTRGTFWARGIDGRMYYGWHNGAGMYCKMRLSKNQKDMRQ